MVDIWIAGDEVYSMMRDVLKEHHKGLYEWVDEIAIIMRDKEIPDNPSMYGTVKKASPIVSLLLESESGTPLKYIFEINAQCWNAFSDNQRIGLLDHLLCSCSVEYNDKSDVYKFGLKKPDIQMFKEEVKRNGVWMDLSEEGSSGADVVQKVEDAIL